MKSLLVCVLITSTLCACDKGKDNDSSAPAPTKVENENLAAIPGAWMGESYKAAYDLANSQNPDSACALLVKREGRSNSMTTPGNYLLIGQNGTLQNCEAKGGVDQDGRAIPITIQCVLQNEVKLDLETGEIQMGKRNCKAKFSANETKAIFSATCDGVAQTLPTVRVTPKGFETFLTVANDCLVRANAQR